MGQTMGEEKMSEFYCIACEKVFTDSTIHLCPHKKDWGADKDSNPLKEYNETLESIYNCMEEKEPNPYDGDYSEDDGE